MKFLAHSLRKLLAKITPNRGMSDEEAYLAEAQNLYDLEYRFRELDRRRAAEQSFTHLRHF